MAWSAWVVAGGLVAGVAAACWWGRGFLHHAIRQARGDKRSPQPVRAYAHALGSEAKATLSGLVSRAATWFQDPPGNVLDREGGPPLVLVPEPALGWASMAELARLFREHGFRNVHIVDPSQAGGTVEALGALVRDRLERVTDEAGSLAVGVAHGAGGLALRWAMDRAGSARVAHAVFVGTPHAGTRRVPFGGLDRSQVGQGASGVSGGMEDAPWVPCTGVFSHVDDRVVPAASARWGDQAVAVPGVGHRGLVWEGRSTRVVLAAVVAALAGSSQGG